MKKDIDIKIVINEPAFAALMAGRVAEHDALVIQEMDRLAKECDVIILGQISLAHVRHDPGQPVFQVGRSGYAEAERLLYPD